MSANGHRSDWLYDEVHLCESGNVEHVIEFEEAVIRLASFCRETHKLLACSGLALSRGEWVAGPALLKAYENRAHVRKTGERAVSALILNRCTATARRHR